MKLIDTKYLTSKRLKSYAANRNIEVYFDEERQDLSLHFIELKDNQTDDDFLAYDFKTGDNRGLFYGVNYQMVGLEDLPRWINSQEQLKELINYISKEGK